MGLVLVLLGPCLLLGGPPEPPPPDDDEAIERGRVRPVGLGWVGGVNMQV